MLRRVFFNEALVKILISVRISNIVIVFLLLRLILRYEMFFFWRFGRLNCGCLGFTLELFTWVGKWLFIVGLKVGRFFHWEFFVRKCLCCVVFEHYYLIEYFTENEILGLKKIQENCCNWFSRLIIVIVETMSGGFAAQSTLPMLRCRLVNKQFMFIVLIQ